LKWLVTLRSFIAARFICFSINKHVYTNALQISFPFLIEQQGGSQKKKSNKSSPFDLYRNRSISRAESCDQRAEQLERKKITTTTTISDFISDFFPLFFRSSEQNIDR
jgi:hypothetical protein